MIETMMLTSVASWEYRWRFSILIASQPVLALTAYWFSGCKGTWYSPSFTPTIGYVAAAVATISILIRIHATGSLHARVMASDNPDTSRLVTFGIYEATRNPLYVSSLLLFGAYALFFGVWWAIGFVSLHWLRYQRVIHLEESCLRQQWGQEFDDYCQKVPRWWPSWRSMGRIRAVCISSHGIVSNIVYVGAWAGIVASAVMGDLVWVIPFEVAGGLIMAILYRSKSAPHTPQPPATPTL
jgi:protein-S-isoprenylcysteine O-methyltransferase Ste14